jgi:tetratricopeptide (TPR) repeat protein
MKRTILTGILALACVAMLMAQTPFAPAGQAGQAAPARQAAPAGQAAQPGQAAPAAPAGPRPKSPEEQTAVQALMTARSAQNADAIIKAAEDLVTKFPDSDFKEAALTLEAVAYEMKNDPVNEQVTWGRVLEVNPQSIAANLKMGGLVAKQTQDNALDRDEELAKGEKYLNTAMAVLKTQMAANAANPQAVASLKMNDAEAHESMGLIDIIRARVNKDADPKKFDPAIKEMRAAADEDPQDTYVFRVAYTLELAGQHAEAVDITAKLLAKPECSATVTTGCMNPVLKPYVTNVHNAAAKNAAAPAK